MHTTTPRIVTPSRIVALALIAVLVGGLAYLRAGPDSDPVLVPKGAKAGDLTLGSCDYETENGTYAADCGTLVVPENRNNPDSRLIAIPVTRIRAQSDHPAEPIFRLEGGPGVTNMKFANASRFAEDRDVVLVGYRGVDGSSVLNCPEVATALEQSTDVLGEKSYRAYADGFRSCAERLTDDGVDLAGYSLTQQVDDMEAARKALGYGKIDLLSESAGTRTAMIYGWRYPQSIHRSVMLAVNPPGHYYWDAKTTDDQLRRYSELCAADQDCRERTDDLFASMKRTASDMPDRWWGLPIKESNVRITSFFGLFETTSKSPVANAPMTLDAWLSAAEGDNSGLWLASLIGDVVFPQMFVWGQYAGVGAQDGHVADAYFAAGGDQGSVPGGSVLGNAGTDFVWGGGLLDDGWPLSPDDAQYCKVRPSNVDTLLISAELDFSTPPGAATKELLPYLPNGHQVVRAGLGHTLSFWNDQAPSGTKLINTFYDSGRVDDSMYEPQQVDFTPPLRDGTLAKAVAVTMFGLAFLTVVSLAAMALRVRSRGRIGSKGGAVLRSIYPVVVGLGGWFMGVLTVMVALPRVPMDDELLVMLSVGVPVGLGIYLAWVHRDWPAQSKGVGFAAAIAGAFVGTFLGFQAVDGLAALFTAILGAVAGANLPLILLDMARLGSAGEQRAPGDVADSEQALFRSDAPVA